MPTDSASKRNFWAGTFLVSLSLVTVGSLIPAEQLPDVAFDIWDKAQHAFGFAWLMVCGWLGFPDSRGHWRLALVLLIWGGLIEVAQAASGWRHGDWADWLADSIGIGVAWLLMCLCMQSNRPEGRKAQLP